MSKTTKKAYTPEFNMAVVLEVVRDEKTLTQVANEHGVAPSLACAWRDQLEPSAGDVFGKTRQDRDRKRSEEAAQRRYDEALKTIGRLTVERNFLHRFCERNGYSPQKARDRIWAARRAHPRDRPRARRLTAVRRPQNRAGAGLGGRAGRHPLERDEAHAHDGDKAALPAAVALRTRRPQAGLPVPNRWRPSAPTARPQPGTPTGAACSRRSGASPRSPRAAYASR